MEPTRLKALVAVAETGSISLAAKRVGCGRSALNRLLGELSTELGSPVIEVSRRRVILTPEGRRLAAQAPKVIRQAESLVASFHSPKESPGHFRLALAVGLAPPITSQVARVASLALGKSRFKTIVTADPIGMLGNGADLAVVFGPEVPDGPWLTTRFARLDERLGATPTYLRRHGTPTSLDELAEHKLLLWEREGSPPRSLPLKGGGTWACDPWLSSNDGWLIRRSVERHVGSGLCPWGPTPKRADVEEAVPILPELVGRECTLQAVLTVRSAPRLRWRAIVDAARTVFKGL